jgi:hypothetical protein
MGTWYLIVSDLSITKFDSEKSMSCAFGKLKGSGPYLSKNCVNMIIVNPRILGQAFFFKLKKMCIVEIAGKTVTRHL